MQGVHQLAFIGMDALYLYIIYRIGINSQPLMNFYKGSKSFFTDKFNLIQFCKDFLIIGRLVEEVELFGVAVPNAGADSAVNEVGKFGVGAHQPAAVRYPVGFVVEHARPVVIEGAKGRRFKDIRMNTRHTVDAVRPDDRQPRHMHFPALDD